MLLVFAAKAALAAFGDPSGANPGDTLVHAELISESDAAVPGQALALGVRLRHEPHWHTYWQYPGDAGLPTRLRWSLPAGFEAGPIEWPVPQRLRAGDLANYGYEGEVLLPVHVRVAPNARIGEGVALGVRVDWLVCSDLCIPGGANLTLRLPVRAAANPGTFAGEFAQVRKRVPATSLGKDAVARLHGETVELQFDHAGAAPRAMEFFPQEGGEVSASAAQRFRVQSGRIVLSLQALAPVDRGFARLRGVLVADGGPGESPDGWITRVDLPLARAGAGVPASPVDLVRPAAAPALSPAPNFVPSPVEAAATGAVTGAAPPLSIALALFGAFVGGLILNLMPCVFPVLSLKLMALVNHRDDARAAHGAAYAAGVILSFLALAGLLLALRGAGSQIGWGFQLQSPLVIAALLALFFLIGLNLLGAFEFTLLSGLANTRGAQALDGEGWRGSFATGVLATLVASPCTAPFMGAALGFALSEPAPAALAVFGALGAGMAAPYVLLTSVPALSRRLPRPGAWMERLRQLLAFPMFITCVWLFWVLAQQVDADALAACLAALVALGLFAWALGLAQRGARRYSWLAAGAVALAALSAIPLVQGAAKPRDPQAAMRRDTGAWSLWSPEAQRAALARGEPVFVDFTAAWCITCQANKRLVLHQSRVEDAFSRGGVLRLRADWTLHDEAITHELARFSRSGVPLYVLYDHHGQAHVLPEILSTQAVLDALARS